MDLMSTQFDSWSLADTWPFWFVTIALVVAAVIDGIKLKVPNWLTFSLIISGWIYSGIAMGWTGIGWSLLGTVVGLALLLPAYSIGGMGAGDVKLLMGVGAWVHPEHTFYGFLISAVVGGMLAIIMVASRQAWKKHFHQMMMIGMEVMTIRNPETLAEMAAERKSSMFLLPYGIPIAIGTIGYFAWAGLLI